MSPLLSYRPTLSAITDKTRLLANDHIEIKHVLLEACRKYGNKDLNNEFLSLENKNITLNITIFKNQTLSVEIFPGLTIANLKERIHDLIGMPVKNQRLMVKTHQLSDLKTIKSYNLNKNTVIELIPNFRNTMVSINIINENINLNLDTSPDCKIKYIKNFIQFKLNIKISKQVFIFQGQTLDDNSNLSKYGLINMSHIYLKVLP